MHVNITKNYDDLPNDIKQKLINANVFFSKQYDIYTKKRGQIILYAWSKKFILPIRTKKEFFLKAAVLESEPYHLCDNSLDYEDIREEKEFLNQSLYSASKLGVQWFVCAQTAFFNQYPTNSSVAPNGSFVIDLTLTEEELWNNVHSKHRNSIRRAEKYDVIIKIGGKELLDDYMKIEQDTWNRSNESGREVNYYLQMKNELPDNSVIFMAYKDDEAQAGAVFLYNQAMAYYLHGATKSRPEAGAANLLQWKAICHMKEKKVRKFSFVGYHFDVEPDSKLDGIQRFKERFGGTLEKGYNFRYVSNRFAYKIYCIAMQLRSNDKHKKYQDAIDLQIEKYPELNQRDR